MIINLHTGSSMLRKSRNDEHGSELQGCGYHFLSETSQVVPVRSLDSFNQPVHSKTLEDPGDLMPGFTEQNGTKGTVLKSTDIELSPDNAFEQSQILTVKEVKPAITPLTIRYWLGDLLELFDAHGGIFDGRDEFQVTLVSGFQQFPEGREAVDGFLHRGILHFPSTIPVFHSSVVPEKTDIVDGRLNAQDDRQFVIHLDGDRPHGVLDSSPFDTSVKVIPYFSLVSATELTSQKGGHLIGLHRVDGHTGHGFVEGTQITLIFKDQIEGKLDLHQRPMVSRGEMPDHWAEFSCHLIQPPMEPFHVDHIGEVLGFGEILDLDKDVLHETAGDVPLGEPGGQLVVSVEVELQPEGSPGGHSQITQPQIFQDKVKIVVDTLGLRASKKCPATLFVMPGFEGRTGLHGREDMEQAKMNPTLGDDLLQTFFLPEILLSDKFYLQTILLSQLLRMETNFVPQGFDKLGIIENANALGSQMTTHGIGIADIGKRPGDDYPIKARENSSNFTGISFCQCGHGSNLLRDTQKDSLCL
jgi:hypothetical protein